MKLTDRRNKGVGPRTVVLSLILTALSVTGRAATWTKLTNPTANGAQAHQMKLLTAAP